MGSSFGVHLTRKKNSWDLKAPCTYYLLGTHLSGLCVCVCKSMQTENEVKSNHEHVVVIDLT